ncbi:hypothetical protein N9955_00505 [bacterium]|nr:hypothetical protein [bacterium]
MSEKDTGAGKGDANRVRDRKAWDKSPLWDNIGPNKKRAKNKPNKDK